MPNIPNKNPASADPIVPPMPKLLIIKRIQIAMEQSKIISLVESFKKILSSTSSLEGCLLFAEDTGLVDFLGLAVLLALEDVFFLRVVVLFFAFVLVLVLFAKTVLVKKRE